MESQTGFHGISLTIKLYRFGNDRDAREYARRISKFLCGRMKDLFSEVMEVTVTTMLTANNIMMTVKIMIMTTMVIL